jgi:hypothetical protein
MHEYDSFYFFLAMSATLTKKTISKEEWEQQLAKAKVNKQ